LDCFVAPLRKRFAFVAGNDDRYGKYAMPFPMKATLAVLLLTGSCMSASAAETPLPGAIAAPGETVVLSAHAEGAQVYECKAGADGKLAWAFREPIATLLVDGKTVGRHYAGPNWELSDGSAVVGKLTGNAPGATPNDIAWLKLSVASQRGSGVLTGVTMVQRINTKGGKLEGACDKAGSFSSAPYSAEYVFLRKG
jgi:hypothetical protein